MFGNRSKMLIDPAEDRLRSEFEGVQRSYIPMHAIVRIDEVEKEGVAKDHYRLRRKSNPVSNAAAERQELVSPWQAKSDLHWHCDPKIKPHPSHPHQGQKQRCRCWLLDVFARQLYISFLNQKQ